MSLKGYLKEKWMAKTFDIELEDRYCFPQGKDFVFPANEVVIEVVEKYAMDSGEILEFVTREKPIIFNLNGKPYEAELKMGHGRYRQGYYVYCHQIVG